MKVQTTRLVSAFLLPVLSCAIPTGAFANSGEAAAIMAPVLKWRHGGCYPSWCETGWYSSVAIADLEGDGKTEVLGAAYTLFLLNGEDGSLHTPPIKGPGSRVWPGVVVADLDDDGGPEIVIAQGGGYLSVLDSHGQPLWSRQPTTNELRGLSVYDLDGDGSLEVVVTGAVSGPVNTWVYEHDGALRAGWPQRDDSTPGYAYGVFNANAAVADLDGDGQGEIVVPSDVHYISAYEADGTPIPAGRPYQGKVWGEVGVWEQLSTERRGWGTCGKGDPRAERYRTNFAHGPSAIADLDGNGVREVVVTGNVYDCAKGHPPGKYNGVYVFARDRSRFRTKLFDWRKPPVNTGAPLGEDYDLIENNQPNPVIADLDGDGQQEILYASYDGRVHAFWLDKEEHGRWPYSVYSRAEGIYRFASEPVVADLNDDRRAEVLFASWPQKGSDRTGKLHLVDFRGRRLHEVDLPPAFGGGDWNGALAAPTLADIDEDPDLEVILNTAHSGIVAYDLPGTSKARILWGTGRGNFQRTGTPSPMH